MAMVAAALAYYFRPQEWLKKELDRRIRASIPVDLDPAKTVGVPIRRSDKCKGHALEGSAAGELDCPPLEKYLNGIKTFLELDPLIENVIGKSGSLFEIECVHSSFDTRFHFAFSPTLV